MVDNKDSTLLNPGIAGLDEYINLPLFKINAFESQTIIEMTSETAGSVHPYPHHGDDIDVEIDKSNDNYAILASDIDRTNVYYANDYQGGTTNSNIQIIFGKKVSDEIKNRNGWIDATSISKRQEIPALYPGQNVITLNSEVSGMTFEIEYNTLYRGL